MASSWYRTMIGNIAFELLRVLPRQSLPLQRLLRICSAFLIGFGEGFRLALQVLAWHKNCCELVFVSQLEARVGAQQLCRHRSIRCNYHAGRLQIGIRAPLGAAAPRCTRTVDDRIPIKSRTSVHAHWIPPCPDSECAQAA